jgi:hypothetical protein
MNAMGEGQPLKNSICDIEPKPRRIGNRLIDLTTRVEALEKRNQLLEDIVFAVLDVAMCDYCHRKMSGYPANDPPRWFEIPPRGEGVPGWQPLGCVDGVLVGGSEGCCSYCLDKLYELGQEEDEEDWEPVFRDVVLWLRRYPGNRLAGYRFWNDPMREKVLGLYSP